MAWTSFLLGRPGNEYTFEVPPEAMTIDPTNVEVLQRNLAGDLKQSIMKINAPSIQIQATYMSLLQRNNLASLMGVADTFLSFQTRDDWTIYNELVSIIDSTHLRLANSSPARLSAILAGLGLPSIIGIQTPFNLGNSQAWGVGNSWGGSGSSWGGAYDPGAVSYADATRIITMANPLPSLDVSVFVSYTYTGWLVKMTGIPHKFQGGRLDLSSYQIALEGA